MIISRSVFLRTRNVSEEIVQKIKTHISCSVAFFFFVENHAVYGIMWKIIVEPDMSQMTMWRMRISR